VRMRRAARQSRVNNTNNPDLEMVDESKAPAPNEIPLSFAYAAKM
jgi:hypothetical protein